MRSKVVRRLLGTLTVLIVVVGGVLVYVNGRLSGNISKVKISHIGEDDSNPTAGVPQTTVQATDGAMNILLLGSDTREGVGSGFGSASSISGARSDTAVLIHLSSDGEWVSGVSIPRDMVMDIPTHNKACGGKGTVRRDRYNTAFSLGGANCAVVAAEALTGLRVDHVLVVDFAGFIKAVDAIGGLKVCLKTDVKDVKANLNVKAGKQTLTGAQALGIARARKSLGDGSDIGRMSRQQDLMLTLLKQVKSKGLLSNPVDLYKLADIATSSLTTDEDLGSVKALVGLLARARGLDEKRVHLSTLPWKADPANPKVTVVIDSTKAASLLAAMGADHEPGSNSFGDGVAKTSTPNASSSPTATMKTTKAPSHSSDIFC